MKVSRVIEAKAVTNVYYGWSNELQLTVEGGQLNIKMDEGSLRRLANVVNEKIAEQDEAAVEKATELAEAKAEETED
jgi:hypothetical protein